MEGPPVGGLFDSRAADISSSPSTQLGEEMNQSHCGLVACVKSLSAALVGHHQNCEVSCRGQPRDRIVHGVTAGVGERATSSPRAICRGPAESVVAAEGWSVQALESIGTQNAGLALLSPEMSLNKLGPIDDGTVHSAGGSDHGWIAGTRFGLDCPVPFPDQFVLPGLIDFAGRAHRAEAGGLHVQRLEEPLA